MSEHTDASLDNLDLPGLRRLVGLLEEQAIEVEAVLIPAAAEAAKRAFEAGDAGEVAAAFSRRRELTDRLARLRADHGRTRDALRARGEPIRQEWRNWLADRRSIWLGEDQAIAREVEAALGGLEASLARLAGLEEQHRRREAEVARRYEQAVEQVTPFVPDFERMDWPEADRRAIANRLVAMLRPLVKVAIIRDG